MTQYIQLLKDNGLLKVIDKEVDIDLEMAHIAYVEVKKDDSKALLFTNAVHNGKKYDYPVLMNLFGSFKATNLLMGKDANDVASEIQKLLKLKPPVGFMNKLSMFGDLFKLKNVFPKRLSKQGICQEVIKQNDEINLYELPILKTWEKDAAQFITMGQVYTKSLDGSMDNVGMYRLQVHDKKSLGMHWQIHKDSSHFFNEYKKAGKKMPVSIAVGGDPLYTWAATAPLPPGMFELLMYGFVKGESAKLVKSITNDIFVPHDVDFVIEGWVDTSKLKVEGPFGDHTGYYTLEEEYPVLEVTAITMRQNPTFLATVVGKPPLEDKFMGWATERIFLPLLKTTVPDLIDYNMPENGVFHNLIIAKINAWYPGQAKQAMHAFWGVGQMSFVKHAIFVGSDAPDLEDYDALADYILNRVDIQDLLISQGVCDALDHSSPKALYGGKLGIDATSQLIINNEKLIIKDKELLEIAKSCDENVVDLRQYKTNTDNPICVIGVDKKVGMKSVYEKLEDLYKYTSIIVFVDHYKNDLDNAYMLVWRVVNNIDATRDIYVSKTCVGIDGTQKNQLDGYERTWPDDTNCSEDVIKNLREKKLIDIDDEFLQKYQIIRSCPK
jgi:4-hydroxy-3-polyprenylbenzoate decarboxylase